MAGLNANRTTCAWIAVIVACFLMLWTVYSRLALGGEDLTSDWDNRQASELEVPYHVVQNTPGVAPHVSTEGKINPAGVKPKAMAGEFQLVREHYFPDFEGLTVIQADAKLYRHLQTMTGRCSAQQRFGRQGDGGYTVCMDRPYAPARNNCLVYSFGIRNEWSFDDAIYNQLGCEVHSFDPSMPKRDHMHSAGVRFHQLGLWGEDTVNDLQWNLMTLSTLINFLGHQRRVIDYLKIDVEGAEWPALQEMLATNSTRNVKQMIFEIHTPKFKGTNMTVVDYAQVYKDMTRLQSQLGFRLYMEKHGNGCCGRFTTLTHPQVHRESKPRHLCCYELFYVNVNFAQNGL